MEATRAKIRERWGKGGSEKDGGNYSVKYTCNKNMPNENKYILLTFHNKTETNI